MQTMKELESEFLTAHKAGDRETAGKLAREIKRRRGADGWLEQGKAGLVEGVAAIPGMIGDSQQLTGQVARTAAQYFGASPETADKIGSIAHQFSWGPLPMYSPVKQMPTTPSIIGGVENQIGKLPAYEEGTTGQKYLRTVGRVAPSAVFGPGRVVTNIAAGVGSGLLSEAAGQAAEGTGYENAARVAGGIAGGVVGGGLGQAVSRPRAPFRGIPAGSQQRVGKALRDEFGPDYGAAIRRGEELGDDAMVMNLGARPAQQAITVARLPSRGSTIIREAVKDQRSRATSRVEQDWQDAVGPAVSRYENRVQKAATQAGTSDLYTIARGRPVDPTPVKDAVTSAIQEAGNDRTTRAAIDDIGQMLVNPNTKQLVTDAAGLVNARRAIDTRIREIGARLTNNPADDVYKLGSQTTTGRQLIKVRAAINNTLHQDDVLREADATFAGAERVAEAYDKGRTKVIGSGDNVIEPEALRAWLDDPKVTMQEKEALLRGISQRGTQNLRDIRPNRNEGAAFGNSVATPNNLARIREAAGQEAADTVEKMAKREDLFARDANRATANSVSSDALLGSKEFPAIGESANYANASQVTLPGAVNALAVWAANKATGGVIASRRAAIAEGAAELLTASGSDRGRVVRRLMGYAAKLEKGDPARTMLMRAIYLSRNAQPYFAEDANGNRYDINGNLVQ